MNLNFNFNGKTLLREWWKTVKDNFQKIQDAFNTHRTASELDHPDKSVKQKHIADYSIGTQQIAQYAVTDTKIYPAAVQTAHIKDGDVTNEKLEQSIQDFIHNEPIIRKKDIDDLRKLIEGENGSVWQNDYYLEWQNNGMEISQVTYNQSSNTADIEIFVSGRLIVNGAYIYDDSAPKTLKIEHEGGESHEVIKTVQLSIDLNTGKTEILLAECTTAEQDMEAHYEQGCLTVDIGRINIYHEPFSPYVSVEASFSEEENYYNDCPPLFLPALHKHSEWDTTNAAIRKIKNDLYGDTAKYTIIAPKEIPELDDDNNITIDTSKIMVFKEGNDISGSWEYPEYTLSIDTISNNYIYMMYDAELGTIMLSNQDDKLPEGEYDNGNCEQ